VIAAVLCLAALPFVFGALVLLLIVAPGQL